MNETLMREVLKSYGKTCELPDEQLKEVYIGGNKYAGLYGTAAGIALVELLKRGWWVARDDVEWIKVIDMTDDRLLRTCGHIIKSRRAKYSELQRRYQTHREVGLCYPRTDAGWDTVDDRDDDPPIDPGTFVEYLRKNVSLPIIVSEIERREIAHLLWTPTRQALKAAGFLA